MSNNKLDILKYKGNFDKAIYLQQKLNERVFSKTEIDVVYSDFTNWERNGLLDISDNTKKGSHKKLSYVDYVWVSIVKELRSFGFTYDEIKLVKKDMTFLRDGQAKMQSDITMIKKVLLDPDDGTISRVNRNTDFRKKANAAIWSIWVVMIGVIAKLIFWN